MKTLRDIGEFGFINRIAIVGDDTAVLKHKKDEHLLFTCDMLIEGVHFKLHSRAPLRVPYMAGVGWKAVCCSVSDIAAMGGVPKWAVISAGLPSRLPVKAAEGIFAGAQKAAGKYGVSLVGGDTTRSDKIVIDVSMIGTVKKKHLCLRSEAKQEDFIFVSGALGGAVKSGRHLRFEPRLKLAQWLVKKFKVGAMMDISDGLAGDLGHILKASKAGAIIHERLLPVSKDARKREDALFEGEDFELLFTMRPSEGKKLIKAKPPVKTSFIGQIIDERAGLLVVDRKMRARKLQARAFTHF